ncbi:MAG: PASTA domain-containing protein [Candidatus Latescibacteria bacterium]|nr:PASTA domain-containing protein [Candidatus Latescibacterota bacterium]
MNPSLRSAAILSGVVLATLVVYLTAVDKFLMPYVVDVGKVHVPKLDGLTVEQARRQLRQRDLRLGIRDSVHHATIAAGLIVDQTPSEKQLVKKGRRVSVDISLGSRLYPVPDVTGGSPRDARLRLENSHLRLGEVAYLSSDRFPEGAVILQQPKAGTRLPIEGRVDLKVSSGPASQPKWVPDLRGLRIDAVEDSLKKYEMVMGQIQDQVDNSVPAGTVLSQSIAPPRRALRGTPIDLVLSVQQAAVDTTRTDTEAPPEE